MIKRLGILVVAAALAAVGPVLAAGALDGKVFHGTLTESGKKSGHHDSFEFKDGQFRSTACERDGFHYGAYTAQAAGTDTAFTAKVDSKKAGSMAWTGTVKGDTISGTAVWTKPGAAPVNFTFEAKAGK
jgi:hypothetical protein